MNKKASVMPVIDFRQYNSQHLISLLTASEAV